MITLLVLGGGWLLLAHALGPPETEDELRQRLQSAGAFALIRQVARQIISEQPAGVSADRATATRPAGAESFGRLHDLGINAVWPFRDDGGRVTAVAFVLGGADAHYGVLVPVNVNPEDLKGWQVRRWDDEFWFFSEIHPR